MSPPSKKNMEKSLDKLVALVKENKELTNSEICKKILAWRNLHKRIWLIDHARSHGIDFHVSGFSNAGRVMVNVFHAGERINAEANK